MIKDLRDNKNSGSGETSFSGNYNDLINKPSIPTQSYSYFSIWAEESADLNNNSHEWAFGNGNDTPNGMGVVMIFDCELIGLGLTLEGNATCQVEVYKNSNTTGKSVSTSANKKGWVNFEDDPVQYSAGDVVNFKTITGSTASNGGCVVAWFRKTNTLY